MAARSVGCPICAALWLYTASIERLRSLNEPDDATFHGVGAVNAPHADMRIHRLQFGAASLPVAQSAAGVAANGRHQSQGDWRMRSDPVSLHLEIPLVTVPGPLRGAHARPAARLDAPDANRVACEHRLA